MIRQPPPANLALDNPLWHMAGRYWQQPAFAAACLEAQSGGWSVSHILVAIYSSEQGLAWDAREPAAVTYWRQDVTETLRALRQGLNREQPALQALRQCCKQAELEAERLELAWWYALMQPGAPVTDAQSAAPPYWQTSALAPDPLLQANLHRLFQAQGEHLSRGILSAIGQAALKSDNTRPNSE